MLKLAVVLTVFAAYVSCTSEKQYGLNTINEILLYYNDQMQALPTLFNQNTKKFLSDVEKKGQEISVVVGRCVRNAAVPLEKEISASVKKVVDSEDENISRTLTMVPNLDEVGVDKLWTSVSHEGVFRTNMNNKIMELKAKVLKRLNDFKDTIISKCENMAKSKNGATSRNNPQRRSNRI